MIEAAIRSILIANSDITDLVGSRMWWGRRPQDNATYPCLVLTRISGVRDYTMASASGFVVTRIQIDAYTQDYTTATALAQVVIGALNGYAGTQSGTVIQGAFVDGERDLAELDAGGVNQLFRRSMDFQITHDE